MSPPALPKHSSADEIVGLFLAYLHREHGISADDLRSALAKRDHVQAESAARAAALIPLGAFSAELGCFETIVKFLREAYGMGHDEIARATGRSSATVRVTYSKAVQKQPARFTLTEFDPSDLFSGDAFPALALADKTFSVFEHVVLHLLGRGKRLHEIAVTLKRDDRTIWTVKARAAQAQAGKRGERRE